MLSTIATAQIKLDLDATIVRDSVERHVTASILTDEYVPTTIDYDDMAVIVSARKVDEITILVETELFEKTECGELVSIAKPVVEVKKAKTAVIELVDENNDSFTLLTTFEFVE